jgi:acetylornithine deacetylase
MPASLLRSTDMNAPALYDMLERLVAAPSVSCTSPALDQSNLGVIHHLAGWLDDLGFATDVVPLPGKPGKANLIATLGSGEGGLVLAGHTDTVPYDAGRWTQDPFTLTERDGRFYGLGCCDMKGFFPIAIEAARAFRADRLAKPLTVLATSDEESSMAGAKALVAGGRPRADFAIIGEPTDLVPVYAHKGFMMVVIRLTGASGHSSDPGLGRNALDAMHCAMGELIAFRAELGTQHRNADFEVAVPTLNLGCMHAGDNPNRICAEAELQIDLRLLPGMDNDEILAALRERLTRSAASHDVVIDMHPISAPVAPFSSPRDGRLLRALEKLSGHGAGTVAFGTEGPFLQQLGMETVIFGPGAIDQAHQPDEYLDGARIAPSVDILRRVIADVCGRR